MKNIFQLQAVIYILAACAINKASSQIVTTFARQNVETSDPYILQYNSALPGNTVKDFKNDINIKAVRNFIKEFKDAKNVVWCKATDGGYVAKFINDSVQTMVAYDLKGSWNYTLKKYAENEMPLALRAMVKRIYFDYTIAEVAEIKLPQQEDNIIYRILIKYADNFKILHISNGEMAIAGDYTR